MSEKIVRLQNGMLIKLKKLPISPQTCEGSSKCNSVRELLGTSKSVSPTDNLKGEEWTPEATRLLLDLYSESLDKVGPMKDFKTKRQMWEYVALAIESRIGFKKTAEQCNIRYKTVFRRKKASICHNRKTGETPQDVEYKEELNKIASKDDSIEPEIMRSGSKCVIIEKENKETPKRKNKSDILYQIHQEREENKKQRHQEKIEVMREIGANILKALEQN